MNRIKRIVKRMLHPPIPALIGIPVISFTALAVVFSCQCTVDTLAYLVYGMSAYSLTVWLVAVPSLVRRISAAVKASRWMQWFISSPIIVQYLYDPGFRGNISIYQGAIINFLYVVFRTVAGIRYASVWFLSIAVYYLVLEGLRTYLAIGYRHRSPLQEYRCYRTTAWLLFLLNLPMGVMIVLMVQTNAGFSYPGHVIYLSALHTFYTLITSIVQLWKYRRHGSPILSAAKVLHFIAAMMSILGLQTAMISRFSENDESYRKMMNAITGGFVYGVVILLAVYMLLHSRNLRKQVEDIE